MTAGAGGFTDEGWPSGHGGGQGHVVPKDRMTVSEASAYLAVDAETLTRMASERSIPSLEVEGQWFFSKKSIDKWRRQRESKRS